METDLLRAKHPLFTGNLRGMIVRSDAENKGHPDIDSLAAEAVWREGGLRFRNSFVKMCDLEVDQDGISGQPASQVVAALTGFIKEVFEYQDALSELDDDALVEQHRATFNEIYDERRAERARKGARSDRFAFFNEAGLPPEKWSSLK
ncbi:hypothetical protein [Aureimonas sp. ME7]|uniref:hypothetical protein n=1 Tax=Aureimonas sp. ME7 TaxID=2744252 RepID=UPI0015FB295E|nr:hypothetical protein [Aureimonas sp. ME7]